MSKLLTAKIYDGTNNEIIVLDVVRIIRTKIFVNLIGVMDNGKEYLRGSFPPHMYVILSEQEVDDKPDDKLKSINDALNELFPSRQKTLPYYAPAIIWNDGVCRDHFPQCTNPQCDRSCYIGGIPEWY